MTIGKLSEKTGISTYTLRYYEKKGLIKVSRDAAGRRVFDEADVEWIRFIQRLKDTGMLLRDIKRYSKLRYQGDSTIEERMKILEEHRKYVSAEQEKWENNMKHLNEKIKIYRKMIDFK
ncbi:MerR family transcriptional regulator [Lacrimispora amygdalina]|uniref:MerR family transcriptional regulator n=1 Tax=Lacrimispora amygdalina TaxID=253257 RepID=A0A3E2NDJ7_9FIRM|nr:MerR family transcriptional regulator [Clostridium indicum]RFZ79097.1 MerR family transcriptional regulator [Clostridium indicum]